MTSSGATSSGADPGLVRDHFFEALQVRDHRCLVDHPDLTDDRRAIGEAGGMLFPHAPSKETSGIALPLHGTVPIYQGGAPVISDGTWKPTTSATQARGMMSRPSVMGTNKL